MLKTLGRRGALIYTLFFNSWDSTLQERPFCYEYLASLTYICFKEKHLYLHISLTVTCLFLHQCLPFYIAVFFVRFILPFAFDTVSPNMSLFFFEMKSPKISGPIELFLQPTVCHTDYLQPFPNKSKLGTSINIFSFVVPFKAMSPSPFFQNAPSPVFFHYTSWSKWPLEEKQYPQPRLHTVEQRNFRLCDRYNSQNLL